MAYRVPSIDALAAADERACSGHHHLARGAMSGLRISSFLVDEVWFTCFVSYRLAKPPCEGLANPRMVVSPFERMTWLIALLIMWF